MGQGLSVLFHCPERHGRDSGYYKDVEEASILSLAQGHIHKPASLQPEYCIGPSSPPGWLVRPKCAWMGYTSS